MRKVLYRFKHSYIFTDNKEELIRLNNESDFKDTILCGEYEFSKLHRGRSDIAYCCNYSSIPSYNKRLPVLEDQLLENNKVNIYYKTTGFPIWFDSNCDTYLLKDFKIIKETKL